jgi:uncharacterized membrane protein
MPVDIVASDEIIEGNLIAAAIFENRAEAEGALSLLQQYGFDFRKMSYLQRKGDVLAELDPPPAGELVDRENIPKVDNPVMGAVSGGAIGGAAGLLVGLGLAAVPVIGPFMAAGTLATLFSSAAVGAVVGSLSGALLLWGMPDDLAHNYAGLLEGSRCMLMVTADTTHEQNLAADLLARSGGKEVYTFLKSEARQQP